jgi:flagellar hook protein FlgE
MSPMQIAFSGLNAAENRLAVSANNVANALTPGFQPSSPATTAAVGGGVQVNASPTPGDGTRDGSYLLQLSKTDLVQETTSQILAVTSFRANLKTLEAADQMTGALLDVIS